MVVGSPACGYTEYFPGLILLWEDPSCLCCLAPCATRWRGESLALGGQRWFPATFCSRITLVGSTSPSRHFLIFQWRLVFLPNWEKNASLAIYCQQGSLSFPLAWLTWCCQQDSLVIQGRNEPTWAALCCWVENQEIPGLGCLQLLGGRS